MRMFRVLVNGSEYEVAIEEIKDQGESTSAPQVKPAAPAVKNPAPPLPRNTAGGAVIAQMPGTIVDIQVNQGDRVAKGQNLLILEAMKMENEVVAPHDGTVSEIQATKGASVNAGDVLVILT